MAHERAGAATVGIAWAGFLIYAFWPKGKPCPTCPPPVKCPSGDFPATNGTCPQGYVADPSAAGCCMPSGIVTGCPTCPAPVV